jgi:hypothetical protein
MGRGKLDTAEYRQTLAAMGQWLPPPRPESREK